MLRNLSSPETYFQAAFRVQSPWEITKDNGEHEIVKQECYVFDFALDRALRQISDYSCRLNVAESNPEKKVGEFINFLPVLAYDGSAMRQVNAAEILDIAMAGTSATLLAKRWESALLVNVDNDTLARLLASEEAMDALMRIEGFRSLNADIETIINKSNAVKKAKRDGEKLTPKEKKELTDAEKEYKSKRKMIQEKTDQIRYPCAGLHVSDRLPGIQLAGRHHAAGAGTVQKGHRSGRKGFRAACIAERIQRGSDERCRLQIQAV